MTPVKDQGNCGSCFAFAATSTLEGGLSAKTGNPPVHLSEQEQVDCTGWTDIFGKDYDNDGCNGGLEYFCWEFVRDHGTMPDAAYPYTAREDPCTRTVNDERRTVMPGEVTGWTRIERSVAEFMGAVS